MTGFIVKRSVSTNLEETLANFSNALSNEGFGVLYKLDFTEIIAGKTGHRLKDHIVGLGVCIPGLASQVLEVDATMAALLPCGAFVAETPEGTTVGFLDPQAALGLTNNSALEPLGAEVKARLERTLTALP